MNSKLVLAVVVILLLLYAIFKALTTSYATLGLMQKSITETVLSGDNLPKTIKTNSAISVWFYIKEWVNEAQIVRFKDAANKIMSIRMASNRNNIIITPRLDSSSTCDIADFPLQKWVNLIVSFNGSAMDVYLDGKLVKSCVVDRGSQLSATQSIVLGDKDKTDFGFITNVKLKTTPIAPQEAWDIYAEGFGGSPWSDLLNKYKIKLSFMVDNQEQATVST